MAQATVSELHIYPVKSLQGIELESAEVTEQGLKWDRFWMIINQDGQFATQRHFAQMAQVKTALTDTSLVLSHPEHEALSIPLKYSGDASRDAKVWKSECRVLDEGAEASQWLTKVLGQWRGQDLSLVRMAEDFSRAVSDKHTQGDSNSVNFADGYPYLVCNTASLAALNQELEQQGELAVPMSRFRGNIVVDSDQAFIEHELPFLTFATGQQLHLCKPCERCKVTSINQTTGQVVAPKQPLFTLLKMTHIDKKGAFFGQNAVVAKASKTALPFVIQLGDKVQFVE